MRSGQFNARAIDHVGSPFELLAGINSRQRSESIGLVAPRELLLDYADGAVVAITDSEWVNVKDLLPSARLPYQS